MGLSLGKHILLWVAVVAICSCDKHSGGEYPEVQRDKTEAAPSPAEPVTEASPVPSTTVPAKPTPADFFPTKPR